MMKIVRTEKIKNFTTISNDILKDVRLSVKARFLLIFCLSLGENWQLNIKGLAKVANMGRDSVQSSMQELEKFGYLHRKQIRNSAGKLSYVEYTFYEAPCTENPYTEKPYTEKPYTAEPYTEKPTLLNTNNIKDQYINNQINKIPMNKKKEIHKESDNASIITPPCEIIISEFNRICVSLPKVKQKTAKRIKAISARWKEYDQDLEVFSRLFTMAEESDFLTGNSNRGWKATFDWLLNENNMVKVLEGNYVNTKTKQQSLDEIANEISSSLESGWI